MNEQAIRKTYKYKLNPTPEQERELGRVLCLCRALYNAALEQRKIAYRRSGATISRYQQEAELKDVRAAMPEYAAIHSHALQDVLARLDKTYQAFYRRVQHGEKAGFPRSQGRDRWRSFTYKECGNGAPRDNGFLVLSKIGRGAVRWSRPIQGAPKTVTISREADGCYVCCSCSDGPVQPLPATGRETGIDLGLAAFATLSHGTHLLPRLVSQGRARAENRPPPRSQTQERVARRKKGSTRRRKAVTLLAMAQQTVRRQRQDCPHKTALTIGRQYDAISHEGLQTAKMLKNYHLAKRIQDAGWASCLSILLEHPRLQGSMRR
jgi:putative transposase